MSETPTLLFKTALWRYNSHVLYFSYVKYTIWWLLVHAQICATILTIPKHFHYSKEQPHPLGHPQAPSPGMGNLWSTACFYRFAYSGHFIEIEGHSMQSFVAGVFHVAGCFQGSSVSQHVLHFLYFCSVVFHCTEYSIFIPLYGIHCILWAWPLCSCVSIDQLMDVWVISTFWLLRVMLPRVYSCTVLYSYLVSRRHFSSL